MPLIDWKPSFEIGIASVDHEHKELIGLINSLHESLKGDATHEAISRFLGELFARISAHFALEESVMREVKYGEFVAHKDDHEKLLDDIRDIMDDFEDGITVDLDNALSANLNNWFSEHFRTMDARLHHHIEPRHR